MKLDLHPKVPAEAEEAIFWYESQRSGLGNEFLTELRSAFALLLSRPGTFGFWQASTRVRRMKMQRFPYDILY